MPTHDSDVSIGTVAREELGFDPGQLGLPWSAAVSSLVSFVSAIGDLAGARATT